MGVTVQTGRDPLAVRPPDVDPVEQRKRDASTLAEYAVMAAQVAQKG